MDLFIFNFGFLRKVTKSERLRWFEIVEGNMLIFGIKTVAETFFAKLMFYLVEQKVEL